MFSPETGEVLAAFDCGQYDFEVTGAVIGEVAPVNAFAKEAKFIFRQKAIGIQEFESFEEGPNQHLTVYLCNSCAKPRSEAEVAVGADEELEITAKAENLELKA